jgi:DegV family protein with EDD domain
MSQVCILTDSTAQFPTLAYQGYDRVTILPMHVLIAGKDCMDGRDIRLGGLPVSARDGNCPYVFPPKIEEYHRAFAILQHYYSDILLILLSGHINPAVLQAQAAVKSYGCSANIHVIDSQTTAVGLGLLVQAAAEAAQAGVSVVEIKRIVRGLIPRVYTIFCNQNLSYLHLSGQLDPAQAIVGEMLGITPFFLLENGRFTPVQKARSTRHLVDIFHEFITEFIHLRHIALVQGLPPFTNEARILHERIQENFPSTPFSEHTLGAALAAIIGPRSLGLVVMEP